MMSHGDPLKDTGKHCPPCGNGHAHTWVPNFPRSVDNFRIFSENVNGVPLDSSNVKAIVLTATDTLELPRGLSLNALKDAIELSAYYDQPNTLIAVDDSHKLSSVMMQNKHGWTSANGLSYLLPFSNYDECSEISGSHWHLRMTDKRKQEYYWYTSVEPCSAQLPWDCTWHGDSDNGISFITDGSVFTILSGGTI